MTTFQANSFDVEFDHQQSTKNIFNNLGFTKFTIKTDLTNGCSHYVSLRVSVLRPEGLFVGMYPAVLVFSGGEMFEDKTRCDITVRISDHSSNLDRLGCSGNKMTLSSFKRLIETASIAPIN